MALLRINPEEMSGPRAYYTEWAVNASHLGDSFQVQYQEATRRLKALLLTKTTVVFTATHLDSRIAQQILRQNPILLDNGILKPALREERSGIEEVTNDSEMRRFLADRNITAVSWKLEQGESWFKERLCNELLDSRSVICALIKKGTPSYDPQSLVNEIRATEQPIQDVVERHAGLLDYNGKTALQNFRALLYHMSGARVVRCESFFPQENLLDYDFLATEGRTRLSEETVFAKIFIEQAMKTLNRRLIPIDVLDSLEISDVLLLREIIEDTGFMREYDKLMACAIRAATNKDPKTTIFHLEQLEHSRARLFEDFTLVFEQEFTKYTNSKRRSVSSSLLSPGISVALGAGGLNFPGVGSLISSLLSLAKDGGSLGEAFASFINSLSLFSKGQDVEAKKKKDLAKIKILRQSLKQRHSGNSMLDIADLYATLVGESFKL